MVQLSLLTSCKDVEVGGLVGNIPCWLKTWPPGMYFAGVTNVLCYIHSVRALVNVLTSKQHFHLGE